MNREKAIEVLWRTDRLGVFDETHEAIEMAISALQTEPQEAISKALVCEILSDLFPMNSFEKVVIVEDLSEAYERITALPYIQPKVKTGKWEYGYSFPDGNYCKCSECKEIIKCIYPKHYCPNCGSKNEREDKECQRKS